MIELVSESRCITCNKCVQVCPTNVFDAVPGGTPVIARQSDCQTCFLCEAYCPTDALFVAAQAHEHVEITEAELVEKGLLGVYRSHLGWTKGANPMDRLNAYRALPSNGRIAVLRSGALRRTTTCFPGDSAYPGGFPA